ncbi:hypothetical protein [Prauserella muralis]|uniref:Uncharacterized protein n=1 Tax=Prauserella muralis TaxID=588067 RepID=A0A2V4B0U0_9PSEU|nr:hypothetical protein [Prauserella muralis]PXY27766.1 hypothetical protein BAY60_15415 [Prauserella muralis]TWE22479.1 hypothetical protein FHX69_3720 [Prauserella muralis]
MGTSDNGRQARTVLEHEIREVRRQTLQEFADYAERFARQHGEPGTLSLRHLERLVAGRGPNGRPLGNLRPATARLLERIFGMPVSELLSPPTSHATPDDGELELRAGLRTAARVDGQVINLLYEQLRGIRRLDRQLGAVVAHGETTMKASQVARLLRHSLMPAQREQLAALLSEVCTLAGWQALDAGQVSTAWRFYENARTAAHESGNELFEVHAAAEQAFVLIDLGETAQAVELLCSAREQARASTPRILQAWLAAAYGEALAADGRRTQSLRAFDSSAALLPASSADADRPYVALDAVHLARWRGHALARVGELEAIEVLTSALDRLDPTFARAETSLRIDLASAFIAYGEPEQAHHHAEHARALAVEIGSARQQRRLSRLT